MVCYIPAFFLVLSGGTMRLDRSLFRSSAAILLVAVTVPCAGQEAPGKTAPPDTSLVDSVKELQEQVNQLRSVVSDLRTESEHYRSETLALRDELRSAIAKMPKAAPAAETTVVAGAAAPQTEQGLSVSSGSDRAGRLSQ